MPVSEDAPRDVLALEEQLRLGKAAARRGDADECWTRFDNAEAIFQGIIGMQGLRDEMAPRRENA